MRKPHLLSLAAALSLAVVSVGVADTAIAQERASESAEEVSNLAGGSVLLLIGALVAAGLIAAVAAGGGDGDQPPVSP